MNTTNIEYKETAPKVFISYSWSGKEHQDKVQALAVELVESHGVDVILDEWDLKKGQDKYKFMERCVGDPTINFVLMICDKRYAEKADSREGGVGAETAIITPEIYEKSEQTKFVPIVFERDENGKPYLPIYLGSTMYFDLSDMYGNYDSEYEKLIRHLWGMPLVQKPQLGKKPQWLENTTTNLAKIYRLVRKYEFEKVNQKKLEEEIVAEYISLVKQTWKENQITGQDIYDAIMNSKPLQDVFTEFLSYKISSGQLNAGKDIAGAFEKINNTLISHKQSDPYDIRYNEVVIFLLHELMIRVAAIMVFYNNFAALGELVNHTYFIVYRSYENIEIGIEGFYAQSRTECFEKKYKELHENKGKLYSIIADLIIERALLPYASCSQLVLGDAYLMHLAYIYPQAPQTLKWFPITYVYDVYVIKQEWRKFASRAFCQKIMPAFGCKNIDEFKKVLVKHPVPPSNYPLCFESVAGILSVLNLSEIGSVP